MIFWGTPPSSFSLLTRVSSGISIHWQDGVSFGFQNALPSDFLAREPSASWLPSDWNGVALFHGWNRWGQPVLSSPEESGVRLIRRGPRQWSRVLPSDVFSGDALWFQDAEDCASTARALLQRGFFPSQKDAISWFHAIGHSISAEQLDDQTSPPPSTQSQREYRALSEQNHQAFLPEGLADASMAALDAWSAQSSETMDAFVSRETSVDLSTLSGEQVDAVGLALHAFSQPQRSFLLGDQTGLGKGRILATLALWAKRQGIIPVFFTERPNLFTDFWRDLTDVSDDPTPFAKAFVLHQQPKMVSPSGDVWKSPLTASARQKSITSCTLPDGVDFVLTTYSQFNRKDPEKIAFFQALAPRALFLFDEAHSGTGQSNIKDSLGLFSHLSKASVHASATLGKDVDHIVFHHRLLPASPHFFDWSYWLHRPDAQPLLSSLSQTLVASGRMVRREQDLSALEYGLHALPEEQQAEVDRLMDAFAIFVSDFWQFQKHLSKYPKTTKQDPLNLWGGKLYRLNRLMFLAVSMPFMAETAIRLSSEGRKPVVVCENTLEQALLDDESGLTAHAWRSFSDVLCSEVSSVLNLWDLPSSGEARHAIDQRLAHIQSHLALHFSALPPSPLDALRHTLVSYGLSVGEISGRNQRWIRDDTGIWNAEKTDAERNAVIRAFNSGELDVVVATRPGCSGISLHASIRFSDQRPRELVEWQIPRNVAERVQFFGRVYRKGQVVPSRISTLTLNLPSEQRVHAAQHHKLTRLLQFSSGQTQHAISLDHVATYLEHPQADHWAGLWLNHHPHYAHQLGLSYDASRPLAWMDRLLSRLSLLSIQNQRTILQFFEQGQDVLFSNSSLSTSHLACRRFELDAHLVVEGYATPLPSSTLSSSDPSFDFSMWQQAAHQWLATVPAYQSFFRSLLTLSSGRTIRWRDASRRRSIFGRVIGFWLPPAPFDSFWPSAHLQVWSPDLPHPVWISLHSLLSDVSFAFFDKPLPEEASDVAHRESHGVTWALRGDPSYLLLWKAHQRLGHFVSSDPTRLWLPSFCTPERVAKMGQPIGDPVEVLRALKTSPEPLYALDRSGKPISLQYTELGQYVLTFDVQSLLDDGPVISIVFRQKYGGGIRLPDQRMKVVLSPSLISSLVFHLTYRGVFFGERAVASKGESS
jgi:C-terminal domain on Strawberry notch homologue/P-loop containing NTP hydrolase pore-1